MVQLLVESFPPYGITLTQLLLLSCIEITVDSAIINKCADSAVKELLNCKEILIQL